MVFGLELMSVQMKAHICRKTDQRPEYLRTNPLPRLKGQSSKSRNVLHWPVKVDVYVHVYEIEKKFCGKIVGRKLEISKIAQFGNCGNSLSLALF